MKKSIIFLSHASVIASAIMLLCFLLDWSPTRTNIDDSHRLFAGVLFILLATLGLVFSAASFVIDRIRNGQWRTRKLRTLFLVAFLAFSILLTLWLTPNNFSSSRDALELLAEEVQQKPLNWEERYGFKEPRQVGRAEVLSVRHDHSGSVIVTDADSSATWFLQGWIKAPTQTVPSIPGAEIHHLSDNWYTFRIR